MDSSFLIFQHPRPTAQTAGQEETAEPAADLSEVQEGVAEEAVHWEETARPMHFYPVFSALLWRRLSGENVF